MVGASHASRTADALAASGETVIKLTQPGWRITRPKVADMASKLSQILQKDGADCTVVFEMMDSNFFLAKTEEGGMVPVCRRGSSEYHVDGDLVFAPKELQYSVFCDAKPLLEVAGGRKTIIVSPIPRYLVLGYCPDPDYAGNRNNADFRCGLESAVIQCRKNVKDYCFRHELRNVRVVGPWPTLRAMGDSVWRSWCRERPMSWQRSRRRIV